MRKIFFAPTEWASSEEVLFDYRHQTPKNTGMWDDVCATSDPEEAEYLIIQDSCSDRGLIKKFPPQKRLYFSREALTPDVIKKYPSGEFRHFSFWDATGYLPIRWCYLSNLKRNPQSYSGIASTYDELVSMPPFQKSKSLCCILSDKSMNEGHKLRKVFTSAYMDRYPIDVYGSFRRANCKLPSHDKLIVLKDYKYCLGFDNQDTIKDFFGTQLSDAILSWTIPIFWCGTDLRRYLPEGSFIQFNARDLKEVDRIADLLRNDSFESRLGALKEARDLILNKYNFWPTIKLVIDSEV